MPTLKEISRRLKSVTNIQKITKSMKMVSAAKYARAERELRLARPYGAATTIFTEKAEVSAPPDGDKKHLLVAVTSDRGLCGGIHTGVAKQIRILLAGAKETTDTKVVCIGDKSKSMLQRQYGSKMLFSVNEIGKRPVTFLDASAISSAILNSGFEFDSGEILFNKFRSAISYTLQKVPFYSTAMVSASPNFGLYDSLDEETLKCYSEYQLASMLFYGFKENTASEQSARMSAMDNASKNAGEMIQKLTLYYNRTRQSVITRELIEIISGAAALDAKE